MNKIVITPANVDGFAIGAVVGYGFAVTVLIGAMRNMQKAEKRAVDFANRLVEESWVYLPSESKDKFVDEIQFFNIAVKEDI